MRGGGAGAAGAGGVGGLAATALGLSVGVPLAVFVLAPEVAVVSDDATRAALTFAVAALTLLPLLVAHARRSRVRARGADLLGAVAGRGRRSPLTFAIGWVAIGGYLVTGALLAKVVAARLGALAAPLLELPLAEHYWVLGAALLLAVQELVGEREWWGTRTTLVMLAVLAVAGILGFELATLRATAAALPSGAPVERWVGVVAIAAMVAWSSDVVLARSRELGRPERAGPLAVGVGWLVAMLLGGAASSLLGLGADGVLNGAGGDLAWQGRPVVLTGILAGLVLSWMGLTRVVRSGGRLVYTMRRGGYFEPLVGHQETGRPTRAFLAGLVVVVPLVLVAPTLALAGASAACFLFASVLASFPPTLSAEAARVVTGPGRSVRSTRLGAGLGLAVATLLLVGLPKEVLAALTAWTVLGLSARWVLSARAESAAEREAEEEGEEPGGLDEEEPEHSVAVLAAHIEGGDLGTLVRVAAGMARGEQEVVLLLGVVVVDEEVPYERLHGRARRLRAELHRRVEAWPEVRDVVRVIVRVAPSVAQAIVDTADRCGAERILVGWAAGQKDSREQVIEEVFDRTDRALGILFGRLRARPAKVILATADQARTRRALPFARGLAQGPDAPIELLRVLVGASETAAEEADLEEASLEEALGPGDEHENVHAVVRRDLQVWPSIRDASADVPLVLGASLDPLLERAVFGGMPFELAASRLQPTIVVKSAERLSAFWLRRLWEVLTHPFPPISEADRVGVLAAMRQQAKSDVDFIVLMVLSSLIAITGLVQDSSAVVIGAMIMAPLMSPIVAMAHGIVLGSLPLIQRGASTVARGATTSIAVSTLVTLALPIHEAPREVLARVQPNLLDLVVALAAGAAAAYAAARKSTAAALPGVAIAVALVPPLCAVGFGLGSGELVIAGGALLLFATNLIGIILVAAAFFLLLGFRPARATRSERVKWGIVTSVAAMLLLAIPLALSTQSSFEERRIHWRVVRATAELEAAAPIELREVEVEADGDVLRLRSTVYAFRPLSPAEERGILDGLRAAARVPVEAQLVVLPAQRVTPPTAD